VHAAAESSAQSYGEDGEDGQEGTPGLGLGSERGSVAEPEPAAAKRAVPFSP
jgi:hypothetical protein